MSCCYIKRTEAGCPVPPITDPTGGTVTTPPPVLGLWFECAVPGGGCHHGIGFVRMYNGNNTLLYHGCPSTTGTRRTFVAFDPSLLNYGSRVHVDYVHSPSTLRGGLASPCCCNHVCTGGLFRAGLGDYVIGTANINNYPQSSNGANDGGTGYDRYNRFTIPNQAIDDYLTSIGNPGGPSTPSGLAATYLTQQRIVLVWNDLSTQETGYEIQRSINFGDYSTITTTPPNTALYADSNPPQGAFGYNTRVAYRLREVRADGDPLPWVETVVTTPFPPDPSTRQVCWLETDVCTGWIEAIKNPVAAVNYVPVGYTFATVPANKVFRIALINYATPGSANTSRGAELEVHLNNVVVARYALSLTSNGSPLSPFPFDGSSIDGVPFSIANIWGAPVQIKAAGGFFPPSVGCRLTQAELSTLMAGPPVLRVRTSFTQTPGLSVTTMCRRIVLWCGNAAPIVLGNNGPLSDADYIAMATPFKGTVPFPGGRVAVALVFKGTRPRTAAGTPAPTTGSTTDYDVYREEFTEQPGFPGIYFDDSAAYQIL